MPHPIFRRQENRLIRCAESFETVVEALSTCVSKFPGLVEAPTSSILHKVDILRKQKEFVSLMKITWTRSKFNMTR